MELVGRSLLELVHSKDIPVITSMLTPHPQIPVVGTPSCSSSTNDTLYASNDAKIGHSMTGAKRSFYFRLKTSKQPQFDASKASKSHRYKQSLSGISMVTGNVIFLYFFSILHLGLSEHSTKIFAS